MVREISLLLSASAVVASCVGSVAGGEEKAPAPGPGQSPAGDRGVQAATCAPGARGTTELGVRRLTKPEILTSFTALFGSSVMSNYTVQQSLAQIPEQTSVTNAQFDNNIVDVEGLEAAADTIVGFLFGPSAGPAAVDRALGGCDLGSVDKCTDALVTSFATRAFRRPPTRQTQQSIRDLVHKVGGVEGLKAGIVRVIISPYFHQHLELGENADDCGSSCVALDPTAARLRVSQYEIASRIAFQLTGGPPDDALLAAAAAGKLKDLGEVRAHAQRLLATPAARDTWSRIATEWLNIQQVTDPDAAVATHLGIKNKTGLGQEARQEFMRFVSYEAFDKKADLHGLFTDNVAFPYTDGLAKTYGVARSDAAQTVSGGLGGVVFRPAVLMSGTSLTSPILRGAFIHRKVLCDQLPDPDPNAVAARLKETESLSHKDYSNRDFYTLVTSPAACNACHSMINPVGYALEGFGPLGSPRDVEIIYDQNGPTSVTHPIKTAVDDLKLDDSSGLPAAGAADAIEQIARHGKTKECFDAAVIVNTRYRPRDATDGCLMNEMAKLHDGNQPVTEALLQNVVNDGIFWKSAKGLQ